MASRVGQNRPYKVTSKPAIKATTDFKSTVSRSVSACEPYRELIEQALDRGRNAMAIWQDLVTEHGFERSYQSVKRFVHKMRPSITPQARAVIVTAPGEEAQVDYGTGPMVRDPQTGKYRRTRLFVMTLGYSRKSVRLLVFRSSSRTWAELHEKAYRRLGGSVCMIVLDNLKEGVLTPDIYDAALIRSIVICSRTTELWRCRVGFEILTAGVKLNRAWVTLNEHH